MMRQSRNALLNRPWLVLLFFALLSRASIQPCFADALILVVGAGGEPTYLQQFRATAERWIELSKERQWQLETIGIDGLKDQESQEGNREALETKVEEDSPQRSDYDRLRAAILERVSQSSSPSDQTYLVMIGHGTYQPGVAKFNLVGPDVSATELGMWLQPSESESTNQGRWVIINGASCSGPFLEALSAPSRTIVTATRSGEEINITRFGHFFAEVFNDPESDLDHDGRISVLEAFLVASSRTNQAYVQEGRIQTEHALIDDNGDRRGTSSDFFRGTRVDQTTRDGLVPDGAQARYLLLRAGAEEGALSEEDARDLELLLAEVETLRSQKSALGEVDYYDRLESILIRIAKIEGERNRQQSPRPEDENRQQ